VSEGFLNLVGIVKEFGPNRVLNNVDFHVGKGEIVAIVGQNGAGKSTLMNIVAGVLQPTMGQIFLNGDEIALESPRAAAKLGIRMVHQELSLFPSLSVMENLLIANLPRTRMGLLDWRRMHRQARAKMKNMGLDIDPELKVKRISVAQQQMIEICREVEPDTKILILDEPTSAIGREEVGALFRFIRRLKSEQAISFIYISHRLDEILEIADRIYTIRDGVVVSQVSTAEISHEELVRTIVGDKEAGQIRKRDFGADKSIGLAPVALAVYNVSSSLLQRINFTLREGEVLGLAGLTGSGRTEVLKTIYGAIARDSGEIIVRGKQFEKGHDCGRALKSGLCLIPEDRKEEGLNLGLSIRMNVSLASLCKMTNDLHLMDRSKEHRIVAEQIQRFCITAFGDKQITGLLSGGNQQKVCLAKWTIDQPRVLLLDEPTKGIDIGAKEEMFRAIEDLTDNGVAVLFVSSEFPELLRICDRIIVLRDGRITKELTVDEKVTEELLMYYVTGGDETPTSACSPDYDPALCSIDGVASAGSNDEEDHHAL